MTFTAEEKLTIYRIAKLYGEGTITLQELFRLLQAEEIKHGLQNI